MPTCSVQDLMDDAPCFADLGGPGQWEAVKLTLLCKILQALDPMATCDVQDLMDDAKCFFPAISGGMGKAIELQLMCNILDALGGGVGEDFYTFDNGVPPVDGSVITQGYWDLDTSTAWVNTAWPVTATPTWVAH